MLKKKKHGAMKQEKAGMSESRVHESQRYPLKALYVTPTSASSTATTVGLYSPTVYSGHDDNEDVEEEEEGSEQDAFLLSSVKSSTSTSSSSSSPGHRRASGSGNGPPSYQNGDRTDSTAHRHKHKKQHHPRRSEDLEYGDAKAADNNDEDTSSDKWQVMREFQHCAGGQGFFQVVHLKRSNFGVQWRQKNADASSCEVASAPPTCMVGPHWWLMTTTFTVFTGLALVITVLTAPKAGFGESITGILLSTACLSMYAMVGCSNPGIVPRYDKSMRGLNGERCMHASVSWVAFVKLMRRDCVCPLRMPTESTLHRMIRTRSAIIVNRIALKGTSLACGASVMLLLSAPCFSASLMPSVCVLSSCWFECVQRTALHGLPRVHRRVRPPLSVDGEMRGQRECALFLRVALLLGARVCVRSH